MKSLNTPSKVILALGGISAVAKITNRGYHAAANWGTWTNAFPPDTYVAMTTELGNRGFIAPAALWKMVPARKRSNGIAHNGAARPRKRRKIRAGKRR